MGAWQIATTNPDAAPLLLRAWTMLFVLAVLGVGSLTVLGVFFVVRRQRAARPRRKRQVTSRLSAWEESAARAEPWQGPDPADFDALDDSSSN